MIVVFADHLELVPTDIFRFVSQGNEEKPPASTTPSEGLALNTPVGSP